MDERIRVTTAKRSLDVVLHLLPQTAREMREIFRYALTMDGITKEEESHFGHQEVLLTKFYDAVDAMRAGRWGLADKRLQEVSSECEDVRAKVYQDWVDDEIKETRMAFEREREITQTEDGQNGDEK
jgi:hypothetical protein